MYPITLPSLIRLYNTEFEPSAFIGSSRPESWWSSNIKRLSQQDRTQQRWSSAHCVSFFSPPSVSFVNPLRCPLSLPLNSCILLFMLSISVYLPRCTPLSSPPFLSSMSHHGASRDSLCHSAKSPHPAQQFPSRCCFLP